MTLRRFLDLAYFTLVEESRRLPGGNIITALEQNETWRLRRDDEVVTSESVIARQNEAEFAKFQQLMGGLG